MKRQSRGKNQGASRGAEGFTLVELIVVIAILAILSAVGVSAYGAYIEKANQSADEQAAANISYAIKLGAAADQVADEDDWGYVMLTTEGVEVSMDSSEHDEQVSGWLSDALGSDYETAIVIKSSEYSDDGIAIYAPSGDWSDNSKWTAASAAFQSSNYYGNEESLVATVGVLTSAFATLVTDSETLASILVSNGLTEEEAAAVLEKYGIDEDSEATTIANAFVAYMAETIGSLDADTISSTFASMFTDGSETTEDDVIEAMGGTYQYLTMMFALATAYGASDSVDTTSDFYAAYSSLMSGESSISGATALAEYIGTFVSDESALAYLTDTSSDSEVSADIAGFVAAMSVLSDAVANGDFDLTDADAFSSSDTLAYMLEVLGY